MENSLLGVKINYPFDKKMFSGLLDQMLKTKTQKFIFTINPEFVVDSQHDLNFKKILNKGYFNSADGIGVVMGLEYQEDFKIYKNKFLSIFHVISKHFNGKLSSKRFTGVEISENIFEYANRNYLSVFLLGGDSRKMVSEKLLLKLEKKFPNIRFIGASSSFVSKPNDDRVTIEFIEKNLKAKGLNEIDFLLVGYGHPYQEKWIDRNFEKLNARIFVGVGGTFDFLTGEIKRAPKFIQILGLEWLFRLVMQPKRFKRIYKAVVTFSYLLFKKIKH